ncbi:lipase class 3 family protein [Arabidopsis lyrata subsp. lyrata]|uniref:Lipase class 3 family protein n=1 Tax=Arabidopsis lyrata subsp. lyrata TaxID=81972 RepID=D7MHF9_ARALL|nr:lipase class 3 family protein [Arabidopsis lyrata subsp. lyrata]
MTSLQLHFSLHFLRPKHRLRYSPIFTPRTFHFPGKINFRIKAKPNSFRCFTQSDAKEVSLAEKEERSPFDINLAVILAGFAFESYASPPGTSDPYVVMDLDGQVAKSKTKWGTKEPKWNEDFVFNIKLPPAKKIEIAAWDANLVTPHKRMGNSEINLESVCDAVLLCFAFQGNLHEVLVELDGIGGGGKVQLEIKYKGFEEVEEEKKWWRFPFVSEFLQRNEIKSVLKNFVDSEAVESVLKNLVDSEAVPARQFVEYAFGQLKSLNDVPLKNIKLLNNDAEDSEAASAEDSSDQDRSTDLSSSGKLTKDKDGDGHINELEGDNENGSIQSESNFWDNIPDIVGQSIVQKLGLPSPEKLKWNGMELLEKFGLQSRKTAEAGYIESGLATADTREGDDKKEDGQLAINATKSSLADMKNATQELLKQADNVFGALMVLKAVVPQLSKDSLGSEKVMEKDGASNVTDDVSGSPKSEKLSGLVTVDGADEKNAEEMKTLFSSAESAMEAWAMLATALGHPSFIKSEFEKLCFLENDITDTQVAIWRDTRRKRVVIAFRGTEQVHSGFLSAYDSVRIRIISLLKMAIGYIDDVAECEDKWHVYVTGHSLGGALATLLALELSSSQLAKRGAITVTMYNFGSPRVGNKQFAEIYNQKVKDSWRVVNHRDIIPTVPRLMGYCHVAHPVYLSAGDVEDIEFQKDGYNAEVIGEATPDILVSRFMKGEKELVEKILQTEIKIFNALRDGSALMQHMEDFYYITLLESVKLYYKTVEDPKGVENTTIQSVGES